MAKFRNRKNHGFKRLKRQMRVYDYCLEKISNNITFTLDDISKDLGIPRSTLVELLNELTRDKKLYYSRGYIEITNVGNNGCNDRLMRDRAGLKVKTIPRTTQNKELKKAEVYNYLCELINKNSSIPNLTDLHKMRFENEMHVTTLRDILIELDSEDKIIYRKGKVVAVYVKDLTKEKDTGKTLKNVPTQESLPIEENACINIPEEEYTPKHYIEAFNPLLEPTSEPEEEVMSDVQLDLTEKYDKAVKELIADYILNADIHTRDEIIEYIDALLKITNKLREKLF